MAKRIAPVPKTNISKTAGAAPPPPPPTPSTTIPASTVVPPVGVPIPPPPVIGKPNQQSLEDINRRWDSLTGPPIGALPGTTRVGNVVLPLPRVTATPDVLEANKALYEQTIDAIKAGVPKDVIQEIVSGESTAVPDEKPGWFKTALGKVVEFDMIPGGWEIKPVKRGLVPALGALGGPGRFVLGVNEEAIDFVKTQVLGEESKYTPYDYIPVHPQTGLPIAKSGDDYITNWQDIINNPIPGLVDKDGNLTVDSAEELIALQNEYVEKTKRIAAGSREDIRRIVRDFSYSPSDNPYVPNTPNKYVNGVIDFAIDIFTDPTNFATGGGAAVVESAGTAAIRAATREAATQLLADAGKIAAREAAEKAIIQVAPEASRAVINNTVRQALEITAAEIAADAAATTAQKAAAKAAADEAAKYALKNAPRRIYGREAREALAFQATKQQEEALKILDDAAASAAEKQIAREALVVLTDDFIQDIASKGYSVIRGNAARVLGTRGGFRIGLPGKSKVFIAPTFESMGKAIPKPLRSAVGNVPYIAKIGAFLGSPLVKTRYALFESEVGARLLDKITPTGKGGMFGDQDILMMRNALRSGNVAPAVARDYVKLLQADKEFRTFLSNSRRVASEGVQFIVADKESRNKIASLLADSATRKVFRRLIEHLRIPESQWAAAGLRPLTATERAIYDDFVEVMKRIGKDADDAGRKLGVAAKMVDGYEPYLPVVQSLKAIEWISRNPRAAQRIAGELGLGSSSFLGYFDPRAFTRGRTFFGQVLRGNETIAELNAIARNSRGYGTIGFDFFEVDPVRALAQHAENQARYIAYAKALRQLTEIAPAQLGPSAGQYTGIATIGKRTLGPTSKATEASIGQFRTRVASLTEDAIMNWSKADVDNILAKIDELQKLTDYTNVSSIIKSEYEQALLELDEMVLSAERLFRAGLVTDSLRSVLLSNAAAQAQALEAALKNTPDVIARRLMDAPASIWQDYSDVTLAGFNALFSQLNPRTFSNIYIRDELIYLFNNAKRFDDPAFVKSVQQLVRDYNTFFKTYVTMNPGFHVRNALTNAFMLLAAGANPLNLRRSLTLYREWRKAFETARKAGQFLEFDEFANNMVRRGLIEKNEKRMLKDALEASGATGFGQYGEIAAEAGAGALGAFGRPATGEIPFLNRIPGIARSRAAQKQFGPLKIMSQAVGSMAGLSRAAGQFIEGLNRFQLTFDGLVQGYDITTALARTKKYLFDYGDLSRGDEAMKILRPFWLWESRNAPLQLETMFLNPKVYNIYNDFKQNIRDEENESPFLNFYRTNAGAFKIKPEFFAGTGYLIGGLAGIATGRPGEGARLGESIGQRIGESDIYLQPDLGFPGGGRPGLYEQFTTDPESLLAGLTPPIRVLLETWKNKQFFNDRKITDERDADAMWNDLRYILTNIGAPIAPLQKILNFTPARRLELAQQIFGTKEVSDYQKVLNEELNSLWSFVGLPVFQLLPQNEKSEIWRRFYQLLDETDKYNWRNRKKLKEQQEELEQQTREEQNR